MTLENAFDEFIIEQQIRGNSSKTIRYYTDCIGYFCDFKGKDSILSDISVFDLKSYYLSLANRNISTVTIQTYIRAVRAFFSWCYYEEYIAVNLSQKFKLPKAKRKTIDILTDNEVTTLLKSFDTKNMLELRNLCICLLMLDSGLRVGEVVSLKITSLHIADGYIVVTGKGNKERFVPLGLNTKKWLLRYLSRRNILSDKTPLFLKDNLIPLEMSTIKQLFRKLKVTLNMPRIRPHLLRHTFATRYLENGGDIYSLQVILGHTSLDMVKKYVHFIPSKIAVYFSNYSPIDNLKKKR